MKNIYHNCIVCFCFFMPFSLSLSAQCKATISGSTCGGNIITVSPCAEDAKDVLWIKNGVPSMVRTTYASLGNVITTGLDIPSGIAFDNEGNMYVSEYRNNSIIKFSNSSDTGIVIAGGNGQGDSLNQLNGPEDVQVDSGGNIFIADVYNYRIMKWAPGAVTGEVVAGGNGMGPALNQFNWPNALSLDRSGNIYVADVYNNRIVKWEPGAKTGQLVAGSSNSYGAGANQLYHPLGIVVDDSGYMYISDFLNCRIQKWAPGATTGVTIAGTAGSSAEGPNKVLPEELCLDKQGNIFVIDSYTQGVKKWQPGKKNGYTVAGGYGLGYSPYQLYFPRGVYVNDKGDLYVAVGGDGETGHGVIEVFYKTVRVDTNYYTAEKAFNYSALVFGKNGWEGLSSLFKVNATPFKPSPISGLFKVAPLQTNVSYSVKGKTGTRYHWTLPKGVQVISGQGTPAITVNWSDKGGYISVHALNECAVSDERIGYVSIVYQTANISSLSAEDDKAAKLFRVYPNPAKDKICMEYQASSNEEATLKITDMAGKILLTEHYVSAEGNNAKQVIIARLKPGIYMATIYRNKKVPLNAEIVKQ